MVPIKRRSFLQKMMIAVYGSIGGILGWESMKHVLDKIDAVPENVKIKPEAVGWTSVVVSCEYCGKDVPIKLFIDGKEIKE